MVGSHLAGGSVTGLVVTGSGVTVLGVTGNPPLAGTSSENNLIRLDVLFVYYNSAFAVVVN